MPVLQSPRIKSTFSNAHTIPPTTLLLFASLRNHPPPPTLEISTPSAILSPLALYTGWLVRCLRVRHGTSADTHLTCTLTSSLLFTNKTPSGGYHALKVFWARTGPWSLVSRWKILPLNPITSLTANYVTSWHLSTSYLSLSGKVATIAFIGPIPLPINSYTAMKILKSNIIMTILRCSL